MKLDRFTIINSMAVYYSISPYAYVMGNPVRYIDPTGMFVDDYLLREDGRIAFAGETEDKFDRLFYINPKANKLADMMQSITINDRNLLPQLANDPASNYKGHYGVTGNVDDAFNLFTFAANNSNVEWAMNGYKEGNSAQYLIMTTHNQWSVTNTNGSYSEMNMNFNIHSHPNDQTIGASGYNVGLGGKISYSDDMLYISKRYNRLTEAGKSYPGQFPNHWIYNVDQRTLYHYTPWNPASKTIPNVMAPGIMKNSIINKNYNR